MKYIGYCRVSTAKQGRSGLGLESQEQIIKKFIANQGGELVKVYVEVESGKVNDRPELQEAIHHAGLIGGQLIIAKLDRLSRDLGFIVHLQKSKVDFKICDLPGADHFTIHLYGALAQRERELISERTRAGLQAAKARGKELGKPENRTAEGVKKGGVQSGKVRAEEADHFAAQVRPIIEDLQAQGLSLRGIAKKLNSDGILTKRRKAGGWSAQAVKNILARIHELHK